ncbi:TetR/AcrR family transcriptional regulator [Streptococcus gallolyticus]|uniref:TetR/AcrR family transcriptional regulator n=1 Tax=Streptococcus gallolyticus TaxID=315405 RepID=UPI002283BF23|nr:TetR/AcrR family transcriptional regulator [Streptococcus gallolyticus]MCY7172584.1 TetR/AcrR family transcriptional regulator [Streptococcus gallolyticus subsp. gallolyticus]MCY7187815.1 TetR/AcrR family transcriptional regulator [Streptococcus gallolyticus subsp. gallolyticus]
MVWQTREKIIDAFFELAQNNPEKNKFTISEIAQQAGISRQAIYQKHFKNFQEIIDYIHEILDKQIYQIYANYDITKDGNPFIYVADNVLPVIYEGKEWIACLYISAIDPSFEQFIVSTYTKWGVENVHPQSEKFHLPDDVLTQLIVEQTMVIIKNWIIQENPTPPDEFKDDFLRLINSPLSTYLNVDNNKTSNQKEVNHAN